MKWEGAGWRSRPVVADDDHAEDGAGARDGAHEPIDIAPQLAPHPVALQEAVEDDRQALGRHHDEVR